MSYWYKYYFGVCATLLSQAALLPIPIEAGQAGVLCLNGRGG